MYRSGQVEEIPLR